MNDKTYNVILTGKIYGNELHAKQALCQLFKKDEAFIDHLLLNAPKVIKKNIDWTQAKNFESLLQKCGAEVNIEPVTQEKDNWCIEPLKEKPKYQKQNQERQNQEQQCQERQEDNDDKHTESNNTQDDSSINDAYQPPSAELQNFSQIICDKLSIVQILFSFEGRINRLTWWLYCMLLPLFFSIVYLFVLVIFLPDILKNDFELIIENYEWLSISYFIVGILNVWITLAVTAKRFHDIGKSGWYSLLWISIIGSIYIFISNGFFRGDDKRNMFGNPQL